MAKLNVIIPVADVEINGAKYRKVDRSAQEGDVIRITDEDAPSYVIDGAFYEVDEIDSAGDPQITDEDGDSYDAGGNLTFEVYEKVTEQAAQQYREVKRYAKVPAGPERLKVGEYAKVVTKYYEHEVGDVLEITGEALKHDFHVRNLATGKMGCIYNDKITLATDEEVAVAKAQLFNVGDTVKLTLADGESPKYGFGGVENGDIGKVVSTPAGTDRTCPWIVSRRVKLVVPVEQRFDRAS